MGHNALATSRHGGNKKESEQDSPSHIPGGSPLRVVVSGGIVHWVAVMGSGKRGGHGSS